MRKYFVLVSVIGVLRVLGPDTVQSAELAEMTNAQLAQSIMRLESLVESQGKEIIALRQRLEAQPVHLPQRLWNPEIGMVADMALSLDSPKADEEGADRISVRELELTFGSAVDSHSRFDATLGIADFEDMSIEEAYLTRYGLPGDRTVRVGRFLPRIGKSISVHRDSLDTVDEPLVIEKYFGRHGYPKTGVDLTSPIDLPWAITHEVTLGVLEGGNGEEGTLFGQTRRHPTVYSHLKNYADLNDTTGLEVGVSHLAGSRDEDSSFEVNVIGLDGTLIHRYADQRHLKLQSEAFYVNRTESFYVREDEDTGEVFEEDLDDAGHLWGGYVLADWRFSPQWATGFRFDDVQLIETADDFANVQSTERGYTAYLTFYQSEFARWRAQFTRQDLTSGEDNNLFLIQGTFTLGGHKHEHEHEE